MKVYQKGKMWKVAGSSSKYATKEKALKAAGLCPECEKEECECGSITEGCDNRSDSGYGEFWFLKDTDPKVP